MVVTARAASAQGTPAGTRVQAWATATFTSGGQAYVAMSDTAEIVVAQVAGADVEPPRVATGTIGGAVVFPHTLANVGNGPDSFTVTAVSARGWGVTIYRDVNADALLDAGDSLLAGPLSLGYAGRADLLVQLAVPNDRTVLGTSDMVRVTATSRFDPAVSDLLDDRLDVPNAPLTVGLAKAADRAIAVAGEVITYTLSYATAGSGSASMLQIADTVPAGTSYVPGTLRWNGNPLTDASGDDAGAIRPGGSGVVTVDLGAVAAGAAGTAGTVTFQVRADPGPQRIVSNRGHAVCAWGGASDTTSTNVAQTTVLGQQLALVKTLVGPAQALVGQEVSYALRYANATGAPATNAVLTDTLPAGLEFARAVPAPSTTGPVLSWSLGNLAPGDSGVIDLVVRVSSSVRDTLWVRNGASLEASNATSQAALAEQVALVGPPSAAVVLELSAGVLEVGVGEVIPYTIVVRNTGLVPLTGIRIDNRLPAGGRYAIGTAVGADSAWSAGEYLFLSWGAALAPGEARTVRFAVALTSAPGAVAEARASATAQAATGTATSPETVAWVQIRRAWPMETRVAIGKVWADVDGDGVQGAGDAGLAGVDVWSEDGEVATTDSTGKFSFTNLRPGRHAFRLDPRSLPDGYRLGSEDLQLVDASGWTTPRVDFRLIPGTARLGASHHSAARPLPPRAARREPPRHPVAFTFTAVPLAEPRDPEGSFPQHALPAGRRARVRYEVTVRQPRGQPFDGLVSFSPIADSAIVYRDGVQFTRYTSLDNIAIPVPPARPAAEIRIVAWSPERGGSATMRLHLARSVLRARAQVHNPPRPVVLTVGAPGSADALPAADSAGDAEAIEPAVAETVFVRPARTAVERATERRASLVRGAGIEIFAPADGAVLAGDRVYVGVRGEASTSVVLYDGAAPIDTAEIRVDGVHDFIALPLARGPHRLRVRMKNSWGVERWDSIAVHVTGLPARFEVPNRLTLVADGRSEAVAQVRVLDRWGVPVAQPAYVTAAASGAEVVGRDADPSSVGLQLLSSASGRLAVALRPGHAVGRGVLELRSGDARVRVPFEVLPEVRPLTVVGSGQVGVGASPDAHGAITAQGRLDERTSLTLSLDSRRLDAGREAFGRSHDPLAEAQYPILGDAGRLRTRSASQTWLSAKLERGFDWVSFGDVASDEFATGLALAQYRRAVTGLAGRVTTGAVTWRGFGSMTAQALRQLQLRGAGVSGPYELGPDVLPATEYLRIETRALDNPERAIVTQALSRFIDYQIDYARGVVLFKQPVPAADANGNPVFIVATYEATSGGEQRLVAGGRAALDARGLLGSRRVDSLRIGLTAVTAEQAVDAYRLIGADLRVLRIGAFDLGAEVAYAEQGDSAGLATTAKMSYGLLDGAFSLGASYLSVGRQFSNPSNVALRPGTTTLDVRGLARVGPSTLRAEHSRQRFELDGVHREHTRIGVIQSVGSRLALDAGVTSDRVDGRAGGGGGGARGGEFKATWRQSPALELWAGARRHFAQSGSLVQPDYWGFGSAYRVSPTVTLEGGHRFITLANGAGDYAVSNFGVRAHVAPGTEAWGSYQLAGGVDGARHGALVGLNNRLRLTPALAVNVLFERRVGVGRAPAADPTRALPFLQPEDDYWSAGAGLELVPDHGASRLSARGEYKNGVLQSSRLVTLAGEVGLNASLALLSRQEYVENARPGAALQRRASSLWGLAFRPLHSNRLNVLGKLQVSDEQNPIAGGVLVSQGKEQRLIGAGEAIWAPVPRAELGVRYAVRRTQAELAYADATTQLVTSWADYVGGQASIAVAPWLGLRSDARLVVERASGTRRWDLAPALALRVVHGLDATVGYRFGNLNDPDFSVRGGHGLFVTLSARLTEAALPTAAEFWRPRF